MKIEIKKTERKSKECLTQEETLANCLGELKELIDNYKENSVKGNDDKLTSPEDDMYSDLPF
jgi:predicted RNase H-like HicB family nuclease